MPVPHVTKDNKVMWREIVWLARQDIYLLQESALQVQIAPLYYSQNSLFEASSYGASSFSIDNGSSRKGRIISPQSSFFMLNVMMGTHISLSMPKFPKVTSIIAEVDKGSGEQPEDIGKSEAPLNFHFWVNLICLHDIMKFVRNSGDK
jgi:hypothetical protein